MCRMKVLSFVLLFGFCDGILEFPDYRNHPCKRPCNGTRMKCLYEFTFERMFSMESHNCKRCLDSEISDCLNRDCAVVDGRKKLLYTINRQVPGPQIQVCKGDLISVLVINHLIDTTTTIHWHGQHQRKTPFMDGVPMITQCPIQPFTKFRYEFEATQEGTHFYHSHSGFQRSDGLSGALIVKLPDKDNKIRQHYDYDLSEHVIQVTDWTFREGVVEFFSQVKNKVFMNKNAAILISGFGSTLMNNVPVPIFEIEKGFRYRFRIIHSGSFSCPITISIDNHNFSVASVDGNDVIPKEVEFLTITAGERYDIIISANQAEDFYWIKATGISQCVGLKSLALLQYKAENVKRVPPKSTADSNTKRSIGLNCFGTSFNDQNCYSFNNLTSVDEMDPVLKSEPDFKYTIGITLKLLNPVYDDLSGETLEAPSLNNITLKMPSSNLLQSAKNYKFCNRENLKNCNGPDAFCECLHVVEIPFNSSVEFLLVSEKTLPEIYHPIHLHGFHFRVLAHERFDRNITTAEVEDMDRKGLLKRNFNDPPMKDTVTVPNSGYIILRFIADNEGYWFLHCHMEFHMELGMAMAFKVGKPKPPPKNFPRCGDYTESTFDFNKES